MNRLFHFVSCGIGTVLLIGAMGSEAQAEISVTIGPGRTVIQPQYYYSPDIYVYPAPPVIYHRAPPPPPGYVWGAPPPRHWRAPPPPPPGYGLEPHHPRYHGPHGGPLPRDFNGPAPGRGPHRR